MNNDTIPVSAARLQVAAANFSDSWLTQVEWALEHFKGDLDVPFNANYPTGCSMRDWYHIIKAEVAFRFPPKQEVSNG